MDDLCSSEGQVNDEADNADGRRTRHQHQVYL
jgi:hypothetical protein